MASCTVEVGIISLGCPWWVGITTSPIVKSPLIPVIPVLGIVGLDIDRRISLTLCAVSATPDSLVTQTGHYKRLLFHSTPSYKVERYL